MCKGCELILKKYLSGRDLDFYFLRLGLRPGQLNFLPNFFCLTLA